jgi:hypothetical protein
VYPTRCSKHYRERAEHFRKLAESEGNDRIRAQLLKLAAHYDDVAAEMEKQGR